jgi:hypothetical protein
VQLNEGRAIAFAIDFARCACQAWIPFDIDDFGIREWRTWPDSETDHVSDSWQACTIDADGAAFVAAHDCAHE